MATADRRASTAASPAAPCAPSAAWDPAAEARIVALAELERASGRGTERLLRVARTIADLAGDAAVEPDHLDEAAWFRAGDLRLAAREAG